MNKYKTYILYCTLLVSFVLYFSSCKKSTKIDALNITLWNKPLDTIKFYTNGKWKLIYSYGGFSPTKYYADSTYWEFINGSSLVQKKNNTIVFNDNIDWVRYAYRGTDSSYLIVFQTSFSVPLTAIEIKNDTLILRAYSADGFDHFLIKAN